jgi:hypothetical protein
VEKGVKEGRRRRRGRKRKDGVPISFLKAGLSVLRCSFLISYIGEETRE